MSMNKEECSVCHKVMNPYWMERMDTGRKVMYLCPECAAMGRKQADRVALRPGHPGRRESK